MSLPATWVITIPTDYWYTDTNDLRYPIGGIYLKASEGTQAFYGESSYRYFRDIYSEQGIALAWWTVPRGFDPAGEVEALKPALRVHPYLIIDFERGKSFWEGPLANVQAYIDGLAAIQPRPWLGLCYDPRQPWADLGREFWLPHIDAYLPMCYWTDFQGQGEWADPAGCVRAAWDRCQTGEPVIFILPGNEPDPTRFQAGLEQALGLGQVSIWRRGITTADNWRVLGAVLARRLQGQRDELDRRILNTKPLLERAIQCLKGQPYAIDQ